MLFNHLVAVVTVIGNTVGVGRPARVLVKCRLPVLGCKLELCDRYRLKVVGLGEIITGVVSHKRRCDLQRAQVFAQPARRNRYTF